MTVIPTRKGAVVQHAGEAMRVYGQPSLTMMTLENSQSQLFQVSVRELEKEALQKAPACPPADPIRLAKVESYKTAFKDLLAKPKRTRAEVNAAAEKLGIKVSAAYEALARYTLTRDLNSLPPPTKNGGRGKSRIVSKAEDIVGKTIEDVLLTRRQHTNKEFFKEVEKRLSKAGFTVSQSTLRRRVNNIPGHHWKKRREGYDAARADYAYRGAAPTGSRPMQIVQMDHWKTDIEILSDDRLTIIGRAWLTLAIDLFTRVIVGWNLSLASPSTFTAAACIMRCMTTKDSYLTELGLQPDAPFWGDPEELHLDNAGEFRSYSMTESCERYRIKLTWRPVKSPQYGCHIESLNATLAQRFRDLPGATGSNPKDRKNLRPEVTAAFTFGDLETQVAMIINEYHHSIHSGLGGKTPYEAWTGYFFGPEGQKRPTPPIRIEDQDLRIAWLPLKNPHPSIQAYGIRANYLDYYDENIEHLVRNNKQDKIAVKIDPLDIRHIYVEHPIRRAWVEVKCSTFSMPLASLWQLQAARKEARKRQAEPTPLHLAQLIEKRHEHQTQAQKLTKTAAREASRMQRDEELRKRRKKSISDFEQESNPDIILDDPAQIAPRKRDRSPPTPRLKQRIVTAIDAAVNDTTKMSDADIDAYLDDF